MTDFVVDASVTMAWCFDDEASPYAEAVLEKLQDHRGLVPSIWTLEVANVLLVAERRGRLTPAQSLRFIELLDALPILVESEPAAPALGDILGIGREYGLSSYDAAYLELAARHGLPIATRDEALKSAAARLGVSLVA